MSVQSKQMLTARELINRHVEWKLTLKFAIVAEERLPEDVMDQIMFPERCPIGRWLISDCSSRIRSSREYLEVMRNHVEFHLQMVHLAEMIQTRAFGPAMCAIRPGSPFLESSQRLAMSITALDRVTQILAPA